MWALAGVEVLCWLCCLCGCFVFLLLASRCALTSMSTSEEVVPPQEVPPGLLPIWFASHRRRHVGVWLDYEQRVLQAQQRLHRGVPPLSRFWEEGNEATVRAVEMPPRYRTKLGVVDDDDGGDRYTLGQMADFMGFARARDVLSVLVEELWSHSEWRTVDDIPAAQLCVGPCRVLAFTRGQVVVATPVASGEWDVVPDGRRLPTGRAVYVRTWAAVEMRRSSKYPWLRVNLLCDEAMGRVLDGWTAPATVSEAQTLVDGEMVTAQTHTVNFGAHRFMCLAAHGPPPEGDGCVVAAHACDNKKCFNPAHLRWLTQSMNCMEHGGSEARSDRARSQNRVGGRFARLGA